MIRRVGFVLVVVLVLLGASSVVVARSAAGSESRSPPRLVGVLDRAVWVDGKRLLVASVDRPEPRVVALGAVSRPELSHDGAMLAFVRDESLYVARADGTRTRVVAGNDTFRWSPRADVVASAVGSAVVLVDANSGVERSLDAEGTISDFGWSPDGRSLAVASYEPGQPVARFEILAVDAPGERRTVPFVPATDNSGAGTVNPLLIAGWQPDASAVLVWIQEGGSGSIMQDGLELWLVPLDGREPHHLGTTLVKPEWIRWSPDGTRVAIVHSAGRMVIGSPRVVTVCTTDGTCTPIAPGDDRTVDPAWSPDGQTIAFVRQPAEGQPIVRRGVPDWRALYNSRQMWVANADGSDAHQVAAAGGGVAAPSWSPDGRRILYVRNDALWDLDLNVDHATRLIGPIAPVPVVTNGFQSNLAAPDAPYEPTRANGFSGWATLVSWHPR